MNNLQVLIVEDDEYKLEQLSSFVKNNISGEVDIIKAKSLFNGKVRLRDSNFSLVILDMSLPTYDIGANETGGSPQTLGGRELLSYMDYLELDTPAIVVTQYETFAQGLRDLDLKSLGADLKSEYPDHYKGIVHYSPSSERWMTELQKIIDNLTESHIEH